MKLKVIVTILILIITNQIYSQADKFTLTKDGFTEFVVVETPNKTSSEIYTAIKKWFEYNIRNAKVSNYSEIENEYLTYRIIVPNAIEVGKGLMHQEYDTEYDVEIRIKENKFRIDLILRRMENADKDKPELLISGGGITNAAIFKKNGDVKKHKNYTIMKEGIEKSANDLVKDFENAVNGKADGKKSDW